jgi:MarR family transcriptional regulator, organic hydroperoxide resistance regulator
MNQQSNPETAKPSNFVDEYLLYQLASASHFLSDDFHRQVKANGVKIHVWRVLACVVDQPGLMLTSLSKLVLYEQSRLTKIIDQMVDEGLVVKKAVAGDRRKIAIFITEKGRGVVTPLLEIARKYELDALQSVSDSERTILIEILNKLRKHGENSNCK